MAPLTPAADDAFQLITITPLLAFAASFSA
jgi:hypothetical protein